ncbi:MAG: response regulator [Holophaga sp.]|nr:response regulator [Holophaga sp.]
MDQPFVLIIDDDRINVTVLERVLGPEGYRIASANDGAAALAMLDQGQHFGAVILDRRMPGMDGLQVLQHMKRTPGMRDIPVVMTTAMGSDQEVWEGIRNGAFYYLPKPFDMGLLIQVVAAAVDEGVTRQKIWSQMESARAAIGLIVRGTFRFQTMQQCEHLAGLLANSCPDPKRASVGLYELMLNALEHGNLGISYEEKTALVEAKGWEAEMRRRQNLPENLGRHVTVLLNRSPGKIRFKVQDQGQGFPWQDYQEANPRHLFDNHGRGILLAKWDTFDRVTYLGNGSTVVMEISTPDPGTGC